MLFEDLGVFKKLLLLLCDLLGHKSNKKICLVVFSSPGLLLFEEGVSFLFKFLNFFEKLFLRAEEFVFIFENLILHLLSPLSEAQGGKGLVEIHRCWGDGTDDSRE